jgi:hypothetical protein
MFYCRVSELLVAHIYAAKCIGKINGPVNCIFFVDLTPVLIFCLNCAFMQLVHLCSLTIIVASCL